MGQKDNPTFARGRDQRWIPGGFQGQRLGDALWKITGCGNISKGMFEAGVRRLRSSADAARCASHPCAAGVVIGRQGAEIEKVGSCAKKLINKGKEQKVSVFVQRREVNPRQERQLVARHRRAAVGRVS
jgi:hypothetical protein